MRRSQIKLILTACQMSFEGKPMRKSLIMSVSMSRLSPDGESHRHGKSLSRNLLTHTSNRF